MKHLILSLALMLGAAPLHAEIEIEEVTSPGGVDAWLVEDHSIPFVALEIRFRGGASLDAPDAQGATNLMVGLLEEGEEVHGGAELQRFALLVQERLALGAGVLADQHAADMATVAGLDGDRGRQGLGLGFAAAGQQQTDEQGEQEGESGHDGLSHGVDTVAQAARWRKRSSASPSGTRIQATRMVVTMAGRKIPPSAIEVRPL